eukprot:g14134.t1
MAMQGRPMPQEADGNYLFVTQACTKPPAKPQSVDEVLGGVYILACVTWLPDHFQKLIDTDTLTMDQVGTFCGSVGGVCGWSCGATISAARLPGCGSDNRIDVTSNSVAGLHTTADFQGTIDLQECMEGPQCKYDPNPVGSDMDISLDEEASPTRIYTSLPRMKVTLRGAQSPKASNLFNQPRVVMLRSSVAETGVWKKLYMKDRAWPGGPLYLVACAVNSTLYENEDFKNFTAGQRVAPPPFNDRCVAVSGRCGSACSGAAQHLDRCTADGYIEQSALVGKILPQKNESISVWLFVFLLLLGFAVKVAVLCPGIFRSYPHYRRYIPDLTEELRFIVVCVTSNDESRALALRSLIGADPPVPSARPKTSEAQKQAAELKAKQRVSASARKKKRPPLPMWKSQPKVERSEQKKEPFKDFELTGDEVEDMQKELRDMITAFQATRKKSLTDFQGVPKLVKGQTAEKEAERPKLQDMKGRRKSGTGMDLQLARKKSVPAVELQLVKAPTASFDLNFFSEELFSIEDPAPGRTLEIFRQVTEFNSVSREEFMHIVDLYDERQRNSFHQKFLDVDVDGSGETLGAMRNGNSSDSITRNTSQNSDLGKARSSPTGAPASPRRKRFPTGQQQQLDGMAEDEVFIHILDLLEMQDEFEASTGSDRDSEAWKREIRWNRGPPTSNTSGWETIGAPLDPNGNTNATGSLKAVSTHSLGRVTDAPGRTGTQDWDPRDESCWKLSPMEVSKAIQDLRARRLPAIEVCKKIVRSVIVHYSHQPNVIHIPAAGRYQWRGVQNQEEQGERIWMYFSIF